ncbi:carbohydrate porin [Flavobacterium gilvum]|uniref:Maltoporin n=1 Tax=Flavobacterium gilvum TaxID=1492737 RepID=A0AAC9N4V8_9FLAO|nr:carbohydrate porin [Flavobacterium gilvum]AOW08442.1 maltoporin [Flavobacterium gilvum]
MKTPLTLFLFSFSLILFAQTPSISNKKFSLGSYGRAGIAYSLGSSNSEYPQTLNLNGMGSIGGRFEENDYFELAAAMHFEPTIAGAEKTKINVQSRFAFYTTQGQLIGNVSNKSIGGITTSLPELYAEANNIMGSEWSVWLGARLNRYDDIHIIDHFYFDDHSGQGIGVKHKNTQLSAIFTGSIDTTSTLPPNFYLNIVNGTPTLGLRNRYVWILEHSIPINKGYVKLLSEYQRLPSGTAQGQNSFYNYPADNGYVFGAKYYKGISTKLPGSFNALSARYGTGIANGGDGGSSRTYVTYGGPNLETNSFKKAYSLALTETFLLNINKNYSLNGYAVYTKSRGASDSINKTPDYLGKRLLFNRKQDIALGARGTWYIKNWLHLLHEFDLAWRKDGTQDFAQMTKFTLAPTLVPTSVRDVWERPHFRIVYSVARYNKFAADNLYSSYLAQSGTKRWGQYIGAKVEWWIW